MRPIGRGVMAWIAVAAGATTTAFAQSGFDWQAQAAATAPSLPAAEQPERSPVVANLEAGDLEFDAAAQPVPFDAGAMGQSFDDEHSLVRSPNNPPVPFGWPPPGAGMGGLPPVPSAPEEAASLHDTILQNVPVRLRAGGILRIYGFARGDLDIATHLFNDLQNPFFVIPNDPDFRTGPGLVPVRPNSTNYSLYPRLTRLGVEYYGRPIELLDCADPHARVEVDFLTLNPGGLESRELLRLRLAYVQVKWDEWLFLMGQDWDIISPLIPSINDNTLQWNNGNMGDRRPQAKLLFDRDFGDDYHLLLQNGIGLGDAINGIDRDGDGYRDNEYSGLPAFETRIGFTAPSRVEKKKIMGGAWGVFATERTNGIVAGRRNFGVYGLGFDLQVPLTDVFMVRGEMFHGKNIDDFRGGIAQGVNPITGQGIDSTGGWVELVTQLSPHYQNSIGFSIDNPQDSDIPLGGRTQNHAWYIGNRFIMGSGLTFGLDYENWTTDWSGFNSGNASLVKAFAQLNF
jgi:hypothetical protein